MSTLTLWIVIIAIAAGTFTLRLSFIQLQGRLSSPPWLNRALRFVPVAVLTALVAPALVRMDGTLGTLDGTRLLAGVMATGVAWRWKNALLTLGIGVACLWLLEMVR